MRACEHYKDKTWSDTETDIIPSTNRWNAWVITYRNNRVWDSTFSTGLYWKYLEHLRDNEKCRQEAGITLEEVSRLLKEIEDEWKEATGE
jgi:hypothetical protein